MWWAMQLQTLTGERVLAVLRIVAVETFCRFLCVMILRLSVLTQLLQQRCW
jgi:hypothetical protein